MTVIQEVSTFSKIPNFVPFGVLYLTQDTLDLYIGTGASTGPAVTFISGGGGSSPAGSAGDIQYNNGSGGLGAQAGFTIGLTTGKVVITDVSAIGSPTNQAALSVLGDAQDDDIQDWYLGTDTFGNPSITLNNQGDFNTVGSFNGSAFYANVFGSTENNGILSFSSTNAFSLTNGGGGASIAADAAGDLSFTGTSFSFSGPLSLSALGVTGPVTITPSTNAVALTVTGNSGGDAVAEFIGGTAGVIFIDGSSDLLVESNTAATSGANQSSPYQGFVANYWTGLASAQDTWKIQSVPASGSNPSVSLTFSHGGSSGGGQVQFPNIAISGTLTDGSSSVGSNTYLLSSTGSGVAWVPAPSSLWSGLGNAAGNLALSNAAYTTTFNQTSAVAWLWANTTTGTNSTTNASPLIKLAANYYTGSASAQDIWTIGMSLAAGTNGNSTLTFSHSGSTGTAAIAIPGTLTSTGVFSLQSGSGQFNINSTSYVEFYTGNTASSWIWGNGTNAFQVGSGAGFVWSSTTAFNGTSDTCISRSAAGVMAVGTGTLGSAAGGIALTQIQMSASSGAPTSAGTAGTAGQILYFGGVLYFCSVTGAAGSASWNTINITHIS
jgi:hypothetical protein